VGELAIARAAMLLKADGVDVELQPVHNDADEAGLIGAAYLLPTWMLQGHDAMLAADIGGTNVRAGIVKLHLSKAKDLSKAAVAEFKRSSHDDRRQLSRAETVDQLVDMLIGLAKEAKKQALSVAPLVGIGCPGIIREDGSIERGAHNLPGDWHGGKFNLPLSVRERLPRVGGNDTIVLLHNDAVVQGLSEIPYMRDRKHWGILTIGTGLGNARFSRREHRKSRRD
jgi:predicted NBD/HSP70 family sugar kinase